MVTVTFVLRCYPLKPGTLTETPVWSAGNGGIHAFVDFLSQLILLVGAMADIKHAKVTCIKLESGNSPSRITKMKLRQRKQNYCG